MEGTIRTLHENNLNNPSNKSNAPVYPVTMAAAVQTSDGSSVESSLISLSGTVTDIEPRLEVIEGKLDIGGIGDELVITNDNKAKFINGNTIDLGKYYWLEKVTIENLKDGLPDTIILPISIKHIYNKNITTINPIFKSTDNLEVWRQKTFQGDFDLSAILNNIPKLDNPVTIWIDEWVVPCISTDLLLEMTYYDWCSGTADKAVYTDIGTIITVDPIEINSELYRTLLKWNMNTHPFSSDIPYHVGNELRFNIECANSPKPIQPGSIYSFEIKGYKYWKDQILSPLQLVHAYTYGSDQPTALTISPLYISSTDLQDIAIGTDIVLLYDVDNPLYFKLVLATDDPLDLKVTFKFQEKEVPYTYYPNQERVTKVGDYIYSDGTSDDSYMSSIEKTVIGECIYIDEETNTRYMMAVNYFKQHTYDYDTINRGFTLWGYHYGSYNIKFTLQGENPPSLKDTPIPNSGNTSDTNYLTLRGLVEVTESYYNQANTVLDELGIKQGDSIPMGQLYTALLIQYRNRILTDPAINMPIPTSSDTGSELENYLDLQEWAISLSDRSFDFRGSYVALYQPAGSLCYAYSPRDYGLKENEVLDPRFDAHHWWLPSYGEAHYMYEASATTLRLIVDALPAKTDPYDALATCTEYSSSENFIPMKMSNGKVNFFTCKKFWNNTVVPITTF